jgi:hypothetical protein
MLKNVFVTRMQDKIMTVKVVIESFKPVTILEIFQNDSNKSGMELIL